MILCCIIILKRFQDHSSFPQDIPSVWKGNLPVVVAMACQGMAFSNAVIIHMVICSGPFSALERSHMRTGGYPASKTRSRTNYGLKRWPRRSQNHWELLELHGRAVGTERALSVSRQPRHTAVISNLRELRAYVVVTLDRNISYHSNGSDLTLKAWIWLPSRSRSGEAGARTNHCDSD